MLHRLVCYHFPWWQTIMSRPGDQLQWDLVDCIEYREANDGTRYLFCCTDIFSKYAWPWSLMSQWGTEMAAAMQAILDEMEDQPLLVTHTNTDTIIRAVPFQQLLKYRDIHFFTSENDDIKCAVVERFQRTLQAMIHGHMTANRMQCFMDVLSAMLRTYNSTHHNAIGVVPNAVNWTNAQHVWERLYSLPPQSRRATW